jgi:enterochelin esterase-like enzyme
MASERNDYNRGSHKEFDMRMTQASHRLIAMLIGVLALGSLVHTQEPATPPAGRGRGGAQAPQVLSPEIKGDRSVSFRIYAPNASSVRVAGSDMPQLAGGGRGADPASAGSAQAVPPGQMTKGADGVWSVTVGPLDPGAYRYNFNVDGVSVIDPRNPSISESNANVWSMVYVPGSDVFDTKQVPHGAVAAVTYYSTSLGKFRRMHVYTPPGYETSTQKYPIFYLLHGAGDSDEAWTSVGRAGFILDNLIAAKKVKPMVVVMPAGHTNTTPAAGRGAPSTAAAAPPALDDFARDFLTDLMPYAESHYRLLTDRANRAIAGLSMGGSQTLNVAFLHLEKFAYIGVFSSGASLGGGRRAAAAAPGAAAAPTPAEPTSWETSHMGNLENASLKRGTKLIWFSTGVNDGLIANSKSTVEMLKKHGFDAQFKESPGGHTWINWRNYLSEFAPQLFP